MIAAAAGGVKGDTPLTHWVLGFLIILLALLVAIRSTVSHPSTHVLLCHATAPSQGPDDSVTVAVHGLAAGWRAGEPLISHSFRHHVLSPLVCEGWSVRVLLCLDSVLGEGDLAVLAAEGAERVEQYVYVSTKWGRRGQCYQHALQTFGESLWYVGLRSDMLLYTDLPPLRTLSQGAIHARARLVRWDAAPLTTAHFSFGSACVEECEPPCPLFLKPFMVADDQLGLVPRALAAAYFNASIDDAQAMGELGGCAGVFHPNLAHVWQPQAYYAQKRRNFLGMPELVFTCAVVSLGGTFEPLALAARLNPYAREQNNWFGVQSAEWGSSGAMAWPVTEERDCSGGSTFTAGGSGGAEAEPDSGG